MLTGLLRSLARWSPLDGDPDEDLRRSLGFLDAAVRPETVAAAGYGAALAVAALAVPVLVVVPGRWLHAALLAAVAAALSVGYAVRRGPVVLARARRTAALGDAPGLVARAVLRMQIEPAAETAAAFAAETGRGPLAESLAAHVRRADGTPRAGLSGFADEWDAWFPALTRSTHLLAAAAAAPTGERARTLDRAPTAAIHAVHAGRNSALPAAPRPPAATPSATGGQRRSGTSGCDRETAGGGKATGRRRSSHALPATRPSGSTASYAKTNSGSVTGAPERSTAR